MRPRSFRALACAAALFSLGACGAPAPMGPADPLDAMRREAATQPADGEAAGRLLLGELLAPGGSAAKVIEARKRLDALGPAAQKGLFASLARAVDDEGHGRFRSAALAHIDSIAAARTSPHADAPLVAWFAANHLINLRSSVANLWAQGRDVVLLALDHPGHIGWRARSELVALVASECGVVPADVVFVSPGTLPRTSSGKLRRLEVKRNLEAANQ